MSACPRAAGAAPWTAVLAAAVLLVPAAAFAWPIIDDLETSSVLFLTANGATVSDSSSATWPSHCIAAYRTVYLTSNVVGAGGTLVSHFPYTAPNDLMDITFGSGGGQCVLEYLPVAPADLTDGGQNDRVEVDFQAETLGGTVEISVWDMDGGFITHSRPSALLVQFPFSAWAGNVDPTRIIKIQVRVLNAQQSVYLIKDIRCRRGSATSLKFDASDLIANGPPFPLPWFAFQISDADGPVEEMTMTLADARTVRGTQISLSAESMDDGGDVGMF
ncbi:MAG TPA: hypothetical protein VKU85_08075, partial [bacterium]|nr:hypothetical protein [bacterium]